MPLATAPIENNAIFEALKNIHKRLEIED